MATVPTDPPHPLRVFQIGSGNVGAQMLRRMLRRPDLELVGLHCHDPAKVGRDVGEIVGAPPLGVLATDSEEEILALAADCVVYSPLLPDEQQVCRILRSGKNVVTPVGWFYPGPDTRREVEAACREAGVSLHGTGIHPGGVTELFPMVISRMSCAVTHVRSEEYSDIRTYGAPDVVGPIMGFGLTPEEAMAGPMVELLASGFEQSVRCVVDQLGFAAEAELRTEQEVAVATHPIECAIGTIEPGQVAARRFAWHAVVGDKVVVTAACNWLMGDGVFDPDWRFGPDGVRFECEVTGDPGVSIVFHGMHAESVAAGLLRNPGVVATSNHCVNSIPAVMAADPGVVTYRELGLVTAAAHPDLHR